MGAIPYIGIVRSRIEDYEFKEVMMHELGHVLGLKHNLGDDGTGTLMYPDVNLGSDTITDTDLKNFCKLYGCDVSKLHND
jgi:predicted Zn-dependent protease